MSSQRIIDNNTQKDNAQHFIGNEEVNRRYVEKHFDKKKKWPPTTSLFSESRIVFLIVYDYQIHYLGVPSPFSRKHELLLETLIW